MSNLKRELLRRVRNNKYEANDTGGVTFEGGKLAAHALFDFRFNDESPILIPNLVPPQGIAVFLDTVLGNQSKVATWYMAPFAGNVTPASSWTAGNFASTATEFTNYAGAARPEVVLPTASTGGAIGNAGNRTEFAIGSLTGATNTTVWGAAVLSSSQKSGTNGFLLSATRLPQARQNLGEPDVLSIEFTMSLTDAG